MQLIWEVTDKAIYQASQSRIVWAFAASTDSALKSMKF